MQASPISQNDATRRRTRIASFWIALASVGTLIGCSSDNAGHLSTEGTKPKNQPPATIVSPIDPDLARRIEEADRISRERAELLRKNDNSTAEKKTKSSVDPQEWHREFLQLRDERADRISRLMHRMHGQIANVLSKVPLHADRQRSEWIELMNRFSSSRGTEVPLRSELRQEGLDYIKERLLLEQAYIGPIQRLARQDFGGEHLVQLEMVRKELAEIEKAIAQLERIQPLLLALPKPVAEVAVKPQAEPPASAPNPSGVKTVPTGTQEEKPIPKSWKVQADAGPPWPTFPASFPWAELKGVHPGLVVYPPGPTSFFGAGVGQVNPQIGSWFTNLLVGDIRTGKPVGPPIRGLDRQSRPTELHWRPALSADGQRVAFMGSAGAIQVVETRTGKKLHQFAVEQASEYSLFFPNPNHLLALDVAQTKKGIVYDLNRGKPVITFAIDKDLEASAGHVAISPGGRFLALACREESGLPDLIVFIDLTTGELAGEIYPGGRGGEMIPLINALAFSPDGKELAAFGAYPDRANLFARVPTLFVWNLTTGRESTRVTVDTGQRGALIGHTSPEPLQWFPDQKALLINQSLVIRREDGKLLEVIRAEGDVDAHYATKILDDERVLTADHRLRLVIRTVKRK